MSNILLSDWPVTVWTSKWQYVLAHTVFGKAVRHWAVPSSCRFHIPSPPPNQILEISLFWIKRTYWANFYTSINKVLRKDSLKWFQACYRPWKLCLKLEGPRFKDNLSHVLKRQSAYFHALPVVCIEEGLHLCEILRVTANLQFMSSM